MLPFSVLDLSPIPEGATARQALDNTLDLARRAEAWGYRRFWLAEHHNMPGIASAATAVLIGQVAAATQTIRVGAGGIMLPNHAPLMVAEAFGTLATLFPGRIDLGLGRAPGTDMATARALEAQPRGGGGELSAGRGGAHGISRRGRPGGAGAGDPRGRDAGAGVDPRVEPLRGAARRLAGAALFLRLALRAGGSRGGAGGLSGDVPAIGDPGGAAGDAGVQRLRGGDRRRGALSQDLDAAGVHQPPDRPAGAAAAAGRGHRGRGRSHGAGDGRPGARLLGGGVARDGAPRARRVRGAAPRRTS